MRSGWITGILSSVDLWCSMPFSTLFQLCRGGQVSVLVEEGGVSGKNTDLSQVIYKRCRMMLYRVHLTISGIRTHYIRYIASIFPLDIVELFLYPTQNHKCPMW